ncbi:MAG: hypothetical protein Q7R76_06180 [Candidatus Woesearchaeota archaeon]|nr:hypothetical protein [Candidatus Woesearchaeota archaeon]
MKKRSIREHLAGIFLVALLFVAVVAFSSSSLTGTLILGLENSTENTTQGEIVAKFRSQNIKPTLVLGYPLDAQDLGALNASDFVPFLKISCTSNMCFKGIFYECKNGQPTKVQKCKYGCDETGCKECVEWKEFEGGGRVSPRIKGSANKCIGDDVYRCVNGHWAFTLTCQYGCQTTPLKIRNPVDNKEKLDERTAETTGVVESVNRLLGRPPKKYEPRWGEQFAENYTLGHCRCFYGYANLCVKDDLYQCMGFKDEYFYTKLDHCENGCDVDGERCNKRRTTCDKKVDTAQCVAGTKWDCVDGFWVNTKKWCSVTAQYQDDKQNPKGN